jgi:hypothetical protein
MLRRYLLYLIRWQLSTPILAPVIAYFKHSPSLFGTPADWLGSMVANLIGGLIFFWVDRFIFTAKGLDGPLWMVQEGACCVDCGQEGRGYRLVKAANYDRTRDGAPEYRCEACSARKAASLRERGIALP